MNGNTPKWALPAAAVSILFGGALRVREGGSDGYGFVGAGLVIVGIWIASILHDQWHADRLRRKKRPEPEDDEDMDG